MYKQRLQELCQQRQWALPLYTSAKDGPDHNPRFRASVTVNGTVFDGPQDATSRTSKEAQNAAARVAFHHFVPSAATTWSSSPPGGVTVAPSPPQHQADQPSCTGSSSSGVEVADDPARNEVLQGHESDVNVLTMDARELQYSYKSQLQSYSQKRNLNLPTYDCVREGTLHAHGFKALVTVGGLTFESPQFFSSLQDAENAAAKVALMSLTPVGNQEEEHGLYKNLVQELTQREGFTLPMYITLRGGPSHMPTFSSTVEIEGERFEGSAAKTKKQAETNAAKIAWTRLRERKRSRLDDGFSSRFQTLDINDAFSGLPPTDSQLPIVCQLPVLCTKSVEEDNVITGQQADSKGESIDIQMISSLPDDQGSHATERAGGNGNGNSTACLAKQNCTEKRGQLPAPLSSDPFPEEPMSSDDKFSSALSHLTEHLDHASTVGPSVRAKGSEDGSLLCNRVRVYPRKPGFQLPPGTKFLPFSDEMWVAVSVEPSSEGSILD